MKVSHVLGNTNWQMLAAQKLALVNLSSSHRLDDVERNRLQGILHWIDAIQDAAEIDGFPVVFMEEK